MPLTRSKVKQSLQHPSTSSDIDETAVALGGKGGRRPKIGLSIEEKKNPLLNNVVRIHGPGQSKTRGMEHFMELIGSNSLGNPFARFSLGAIDMTTGLGLHFLQTCGLSAKEIVLNGKHRIESVAEILKLATKLESLTLPSQYLSSKDDQVVQVFSGPENKKPKFPALKYLNVGWSDRKEKNVCPTFYEEILGGAENISTLDLGSGTSSVCLEVLETIEKLGRESLIVDLKISVVKEKHLEILRRMAQKEKGLKLKIIDLKDDDFIGFELIEIFKNSLITLRFTTSRGSDQNSKVIAFPHMPKLKSLHFKSVYGSELNCGNFENIFPSLEKLYLDFSYKCYRYEFFVSGNEPCPTYKSSILRFRCAPVQMENLNQILTIFPTLRYLDCVLPPDDGVEVIRKIWTDMTQLEGLFVSGNLKRYVTGVPLTESEELKDFLNSLPKLEITDREMKIQSQLTMMNKNSQLPSIRNLTNLKYLSLELYGKEKGSPGRKRYLTDITITAYFGLYSLKNLRHLEMSRCEFSKSCSEILVKDQSLLSWEFASPSNREIIPTMTHYRSDPFYAEGF